ncbi:MAG: peptidoglycan-binding protein [Candidatus Promineifilaceae bacterium]|nr:peptidoglycan-binding protein [Candidatus Promineifilaceae bacterium]
MSRKRILTIFAVLAVVIIIAIVSWAAGSTIQSPEEAAARTAAPTPAPILVQAEERVLTSDVVTRGTARYGSPQTITLAPSNLKDGRGLITTLPMPDTQLDEGDLLLTVAGRPVLLLQGELPVYRDLVPGLSGDDVLQLESALERLGFDPGAVDGTYDEETGAAVSAWLTAGGWIPFAATAVQQAHIDDLEQQLAAAETTAAAAEAEATSAPLAVDLARAEADAAIKAAEADLVLAPNSEAVQAAVSAARLAGELAVQEATNTQERMQGEAQLAAAMVEKLRADLEAARRAAGVKVPADEVVFLPNLPVRFEQSHVQVGDEALGNILTVTDNQLVIDSSLPLAEAPLVQPGMPVEIDEPDLGIAATGIVERVAAVPGTDGVDGFHVYFETHVDDTAVTLEGYSLRLTIPVESTDGAVLVVPISALSLAADGTTRIQVQQDGELRFLVVEPGLSADGLVEIRALDGSLEPGQMVLIGFEQES